MTNIESNKIKEVISMVCEPTSDQIEKFFTFYERMVETNEVMNLTAITEFDEVLIKHFLDSISLMKYMDLSNNKLLDLGTGAGFPGVPLHIMNPDMEITFLDSLQKRINYLKNVCSEIKLEKCKFIHGRAEDFGKDNAFREQYDCVVSRAVANLSILSEYALPFVKVGGYFISYKSEKAEDEIKEAKKAIELLGGKIEKVKTFDLEDAGVRSFIFMKKEKLTPKRFPRKPGVAKKEPIK